mgnify:CR=1 FL=1
MRAARVRLPPRKRKVEAVPRTWQEAEPATRMRILLVASAVPRCHPANLPDATGCQRKVNERACVATAGFAASVGFPSPVTAPAPAQACFEAWFGLRSAAAPPIAAPILEEAKQCCVRPSVQVQPRGRFNFVAGTGRLGSRCSARWKSRAAGRRDVKWRLEQLVARTRADQRAVGQHGVTPFGGS